MPDHRHNAPPHEFEPGKVADRLQAGIVEAVQSLGRRGAVVAVSGGVDSGVVAALCAGALGSDHVMLLRLPEHGLSETSSDLATQLSDRLGTRSVEVPISGTLEALGCYESQTKAIQSVFPDYGPGWKHKVVRSDPTGAMIVFSLVVEDPDGHQERRRIPSEPYRQLIAATNMKQRVRKLVEYTWADRLHYAVAGTPNLVEYDQGFFVKGGDGLADIKPIAGLYKQQVYALALHLGLPEGISGRPPTTETFSLAQSQEEFYFGFAHEPMDQILWGELNAVPAADLAVSTGIEVTDVEAGYAEVRRRRDATQYLHSPALLVSPVESDV